MATASCLPLSPDEHHPTPPSPRLLTAYEDCYRMFNPTTREGLDAVVGPWTAAFFALLSHVPEHVGLPRQFWSRGLAARAEAPRAQEGAVLGRKGGDGAGAAPGRKGGEDAEVAQARRAASALFARQEGLDRARLEAITSWWLTPWMVASLAVVAFFAVLFKRRGRGRGTQAAQ